MSLIQRLRDSIKMLIWRGGAHYEVEIKRLDARVDKLKSLTLPNIQEFKGAEERIRRLDARVDKLKSLTLPAIEDIKKSISSSSGRNPRFYDELRMFTYLLDKEFSVEQKKWFIEKQSMKALGYFPDLDNPKSFNEKTQWYKLNYQDKRMTELADKFKFKDIVSDAIGKGRTARLLGVWSSAREVDFESLPNSFVLKSNWGSGSRHVLIVKDKSNIDINRVRMQLSNWLQPWENVYFHTFDWAYKDINPKIIAEEFLIDKGYEYNFFCFNGEPEYCYAITGGVAKGVPKRRSYYNKDWDLLPFTKLSKKSPLYVKKPSNYDEMIAIAKEISRPFPHARVDFMQSERGLFVAEVTFYTGSGTGRFYPTEWDFKFGEAFELPPKRFID